MKVIIAGSRSFVGINHKYLAEFLDNVEKQITITTVISGAAKGGDRWGEELAEVNNWNLDSRPAKWKIHGKSAGMIRNREMLKEADAVIIMWDGSSAGSLDMGLLALGKGIPVFLYCYHGDEMKAPTMLYTNEQVSVLLGV